MVTRVDKKPIIYNTCLIRALKPAIVTQNKILISSFFSKSVGTSIPTSAPRDLVDEYEDVEYALKVFGVDHMADSFFGQIPEDEEDEAIRIARVCLDMCKTTRQQAKSEALFDEVCKMQKGILAGMNKVHYGTEAVYVAFNECIFGGVFEKPAVPNYASWCTETTQKILLQQSAYMFIHPTAINEMCNRIGRDVDHHVYYAWDMFKKIETMAIRIGSRKNMLAHAYYGGFSRKGFSPDTDPLKDFLLPMTGYAQVKEGVKVYMLLGLRYMCFGDTVCILSHDDCINLSTMAQCYFRTAMYFTVSNGYKLGTRDMAIELVKDISAHCVRLINARKNFSHVIRSMHIMSQGLFNDAFEADFGVDLGWRERSANYTKESLNLDPMGKIFHNRSLKLANDKMDELNTCFIYHVFVGDEMQIEDLRNKVKNMTTKVLDADAKEWANFLRFCSSYLLCRFMLVNKKKPACGGDIGMLNSVWANRNISGQFTMPPQSDWGKVWIQNEFNYTDFADTWHLEAQDVAYVVKDSHGLVHQKYVSDRRIHSELLMAMTHGNILDIKTRSTPRSARERIINNGEIKEVVVTTAPKAENAKPSWKKRVTFAADCEFRKMQSEFDRNCRRVISFVRGPSLAVDQCILEKQFAEIADATSMGLSGAICSHDISGWSESMDRKRKFEFENVLIRMFDKPEMINIQQDWSKINAIVTKQGAKDIVKIDNGSFQGFDGSASTLLHSMILIYCIDTARRAEIIPPAVKANMATLIDDCIALMVDLSQMDQAKGFWSHLKKMYRKLGFEVDDLKSIFSTIKGIYLSRRFLIGGEVPADFKVFIKAHSSYEDPLRCTLDVAGDIFGAMRGACDANGEAWYIYYCACLSSLCEIAHNNSCVLALPPSAAAVFCLAPVSENGWGFPSIVSWTTNDVTDKRAHFNAIMEASAAHECSSEQFKAGVSVYPRPVAKAMYAIKTQPWRIVSYSNIFTNPFEAIREGPLKPDMLRRNAIQDMLAEVAEAEPWKSLLGWSSNATTQRVRELLIQSGPLHAPTLSALVNCMPDNYRLSLVGKAIGSESLLSLLNAHKRVVLKRRVTRCSMNYFKYSKSVYDASNEVYSCEDFSALTYVEKTRIEREEFYTANSVVMTDHTFPDPVQNFTTSATPTGSVISPNLSSLRIWDKTKTSANRMSHLISDKGLYVPRRSGRVWEVTCEYAKGWDSVSQRVAMGLAILARAEADGHGIEGLLTYFIKAWNELSNITHQDTHLIAIHGHVKRLDANPGSSTHPIIVNRNILRGLNNKLASALNAIPPQCERSTGSKSHLHDFLAHETAMTSVTALMLGVFQYLGVADYSLTFHMATRQGCIIPESQVKMKTNEVANLINIEIMDGEYNYGLLQACPELAREIAIPTMKSSWVSMINALINRDSVEVERLMSDANKTPIDELLQQLADDEVYYSSSVILAAEPAQRQTFRGERNDRYAITPTQEAARASGDGYTTSVRTIGSKFSRALTISQPPHIMAATAVRSLVWSRLKTHSAVQLAKHLYGDPDADQTIIARCASQDFWRGAIIEIKKFKGNTKLSDLSMSTFRSLGVPELHIMASDDVKTITQSVASFFGSHLKCVVHIISDLVSSLAGRSTHDFSKAFAEKIITNNPSLMNAKLRKEHMTKLVESNIEMLDERIEKIANDEIAHRGDKRAAAFNKNARLVELRCRRYTYKSVEVDDSGTATINMGKLAEYETRAAKSLLDKAKLGNTNCPACEETLQGIIDFMFAIKNLINYPRGGKKAESAAASGWDPESGSLGVRMASQLIMMDSGAVMNTKFAVSAAEIAPRVHKRVIVTQAGTPAVTVSSDPAYEDIFDIDDEDETGLFGGPDISDPAVMAAAMSGGVRKLEIPNWQALYALLLTGNYEATDVNQKLGTAMAENITPSVLREAHLEDFPDEEILAAFPRFVGDYLNSGLVFDPEWLNRDEADAYTTDDMKHSSQGFLM
nr:RNA-dependent RNA polymerase [Qingdao RNA virus 4]